MTLTLGINLPWLDAQYDHDFGHNEVMDYVNNSTTPTNPIFGDATHKANMEKYLENIKLMGATVVRIWVFERFEGLIFEKIRKTSPTHPQEPDFELGKITGIDQSLIDNFADLLKLAQRIGLKFYLCLMDTWGVWNNIKLYQSLAARRLDKSFLINGINGLITTEEKTECYIDNAVIKFLEHPKIRSLRDRIWAVDVLNEPEGIESKNVKGAKLWKGSSEGGNKEDLARYWGLQSANDVNPIDTKIIWEQLTRFISRCANAIKGRGFRVSSGFQEEKGLIEYVNTLKKQGLSDPLNFHDFHVYMGTKARTEVTLPELNDLKTKVGIVKKAKLKQQSETTLT